MNEDISRMKPIIKMLINSGLDDEQIKKELLKFYREYSFTLKEMSIEQFRDYLENNLNRIITELRKKTNIRFKREYSNLIINWLKGYVSDNPNCNLYSVISALVDYLSELEKDHGIIIKSDNAIRTVSYYWSLNYGKDYKGLEI